MKTNKMLNLLLAALVAIAPVAQARVANNVYVMPASGSPLLPSWGKVNLLSSNAITGTTAGACYATGTNVALTFGNLPTTYGGLGGNFSSSTGALSISSGTVTAGTLGSVNGGTGLSSPTANSVILTNGASAYQPIAPSTSRNVLMSTGSTWASTAFTQPTIQKFLSGSGNYTTPAGVLYIEVMIVGGGGGGGASGTAASMGVASAGGNTTFGSSLLVANGGGGAATNGTQGTGGTASLGAAIGISINGPNGSGASYTSSSTAAIAGGNGGSTPLQGYGSGGSVNQSGFAAIANTGSGGGGASTGTTSSVYGGAGGAAGGYVYAVIYPTASQVFAYAVGAAGTGATAGTPGFAGGNGSLGLVFVKEHYQ